MKNHLVHFFTFLLCAPFALSQTYYPVTQGLGTYLQTHLSTDSMFEALGEMGFNRIMLEPHVMHPQANQYGLSVELANWWSVETDSTMMAGVFETAAQVDQLVGINMADEPYLNGNWNPVGGEHSAPASFFEGVLPDFRSQYPEIPLGFTLFGPWGSLNGNHDLFPDSSYQQVLLPYYSLIDRVNILPYPYFFQRPAAEVVKMIDLSRELASLSGREIAITAVLQTWSNADDTPNPNFPSIEELRAQLFSALLTGVDGVSFFTFNPEVFAKIPGFTENFDTLIREAVDFSEEYELFNTRAWLNSGETFLSAHLVSQHLPRRDYCVLVNLTGFYMNPHSFYPWEVRIMEGNDCPWTLPPDSAFEFLPAIVSSEHSTPEGPPELLSLYPNPGSEHLVLESHLLKPQFHPIIKISNTLGQTSTFQLEELTFLSEGKRKINLQKMKPGIYFLTLSCDEKTITLKFMVQH